MKKVICALLAALTLVYTISFSAAADSLVIVAPKLTVTGKLHLETGKSSTGVKFEVYNGTKLSVSKKVDLKGKTSQNVKVGFKKGKVYRVRAQAYRTVNKKTTYGAWSAYSIIALAPNIAYKWTSKGLKIKWTSMKNATSYNLKIQKNSNSKVYKRYKNLTENSIVVPYSELGGIKINKRYKISVAPYYGETKLTTGSLTTAYVQVVGHRGAMDSAPENTLASFSRAADNGYNAFEADFWETKNGDVLIGHDSDLDNCGYAGVDIRSLTAKTLKNYPILIGKHVSEYPTQYIPTMEELIKVASIRKMKIYLHLKDSTTTDAALQQIAKLLGKYGMKNNATVFCSNVNVVKRIKKSGCRCGLLILPESVADIKNTIKNAKKIGAKFIIARFTEHMSKALVTMAHDSKIKLGCYNISEINRAYTFSNMGGDFIITNKNFLAD